MTYSDDKNEAFDYILFFFELGKMLPTLLFISPDQALETHFFYLTLFKYLT